MSASSVSCALCGTRFEPAAVRGACAGCPLARGCRSSFCPRCGYSMPVPERSALVRLFDRVLRLGRNAS